MCEIHTISKSASINWESNLNEYLQFVTKAQRLYWNLIGQNKSIHLKVRPTSSTSNEWIKIGQKDLILTKLLKASGRLQIEGRTTAYQNHIDQKPTAFYWMNLNMLSLLTI